MKKKKAAVAIAAWLVCSQSVQAVFVVDSTYDGVNFTGGTSFLSAGYDGGVDSSSSRAQRIETGSNGPFDLTFLILPLALRDPSVDVSKFDLMLQTDAGNQPSGTVIWSTTPTGLTTAPANMTYNVGGVQLAASTTYWIVLAQNTTLGNTGSGLPTSTLNGINWYLANAFDSTTARGSQFLGDSGGASPTGQPWGVVTTSNPRLPFAFQLQATPEPGQIAMMGLLLAGAGGYTVRRRWLAARQVA